MNITQPKKLQTTQNYSIQALWTELNDDVAAQLWDQLDDKKAEKLQGGAPQGECVGLVGTGGTGSSFTWRG
jgi:RecA-family ATPase